MTARQIARQKLTGYAVGDRVDVMAGSVCPQSSGIVCGYGRKTSTIRIRFRHGVDTVETWPVSMIRKSTK